MDTPMFAYQSIAVLGQSTSIWVYVLPVLGSTLLFWGIYQVVAESKTSARKKMHERLRGERRQEKVAANILRRGAMGQTKSIADAIIGKFAFIPKVQTMLDQADLDWSASQTLMNLCGGDALVTIGMLVLKFSASGTPVTGNHWPIVGQGRILTIPPAAAWAGRGRRKEFLTNSGRITNWPDATR